MKKMLSVFGLIGGLLLGGQALAADYAGQCQTCGGGGASASWLAAAVSLAQANSAVVNDSLFLCKDFPSSSVLHEYVVNDAPVVNTGDITYIDTLGFSDLTCDDLLDP